MGNARASDVVGISVAGALASAAVGGSAADGANITFTAVAGPASGHGSFALALRDGTTVRLSSSVLVYDDADLTSRVACPNKYVVPSAGVFTCTLYPRKSGAAVYARRDAFNPPQVIVAVAEGEESSYPAPEALPLSGPEVGSQFEASLALSDLTDEGTVNLLVSFELAGLSGSSLAVSVGNSSYTLFSITLTTDLLTGPASLRSFSAGVEPQAFDTCALQVFGRFRLALTAQAGGTAVALQSALHADSQVPIAGLQLQIPAKIGIASALEAVAFVERGSSLSVEWRFGDEANVTTSGLRHSHQFATPGDVVVVVTVRNDLSSQSASQAVRVEPLIAGLGMTVLDEVNSTAPALSAVVAFRDALRFKPAASGGGSLRFLSAVCCGDGVPFGAGRQM
eukprot:tig00020904_g15268.t1